MTWCRRSVHGALRNAGCSRRPVPLTARGRPLVLLAAALLAVAALSGLAAGPSGAAARPAAAVSAPSKKVTPKRTGCVPARWPVSRLLAQLLILTGTFTHPDLLGRAAAAGAGGLQVAFAPGVEPTTTPATLPRVRGVIAALVADATNAGQLAPIVSTDEEGGAVTRLGGMLGPLPSPRQMAATWTTSQVEQALESRGGQMKALGIDMDTGPLYDISPANNPVDDEGSRTFSTSPTVAADYANAFAEGLAEAGVLAVAKQFPGEGYANGDTDTAVATDPPIATLRAHGLSSFEQGIAAHVPVVMVGHPVVPGLTKGQPASLSPATYALLRKTLGFKGLVITDTLGAKAISIPGYSEPDAVVTAVEAGADMAMVHDTTWQPALSGLEHAVSIGALSLHVARTRVAHVLIAKGVCKARTSIAR